MNLFKIENLNFEFKDILTEEDQLKLKESVNRYLKQKKLAITAIIIGVLFMFYIIGIPILIYGIYLFTKINKSISINYDLSKEYSDDINELITNLKKINECSVRWQIISSSYTESARINAGANTLIDRKKLHCAKKSDYFIISNIDYCVIKLLKGKIVFLPNIIIYIKKGKANLIKYDDFKLEHYIKHFRETQPLPRDAIILDYTWKYVNNDGNRDKRYKDNIKIPICKYCTFTITMGTFTESIMVSNLHD